MSEAIGLAQAIQLDVVYQEIIRIREVKPATFISQGNLDKLLPILEERAVELLIINSAITPIQQRNL